MSSTPSINWASPLEWITSMAALIAYLAKVLGITRSQSKTILIAGGIGIVTFHIAWVYGALAVVGLPAPFAKSADLRVLTQAVNKLSGSIAEERKVQLEQIILSTVQGKCNAAGDLKAQAAYAELLQEAIAKYEKLTHQEPRVPDCSEV